MLSLERSLVYNYWDYFLISGLFCYFLWRIFGKRRDEKIVDEKVIDQDLNDEVEYENDESPSLEVERFVKVTLSDKIEIESANSDHFSTDCRPVWRVVLTPFTI